MSSRWSTYSRRTSIHSNLEWKHSKMLKAVVVAFLFLKIFPTWSALLHTGRLFFHKFETFGL